MKNWIKTTVLIISSIIMLIALFFLVAFIYGINDLEYPSTILLPSFALIILMTSIVLINIWCFKYKPENQYRNLLITSVVLFSVSIFAFRVSPIINRAVQESESKISDIDKKTPSPTANTQTTKQPEKTTATNSAVQIVSERFETYVDSIKTPHIMYLGVVKNTGNKPVELRNVNIDVLDSENNILKHLDYGSVKPCYVMPGEFGYICEDCAQGDDAIDINSVAKTNMRCKYNVVNYNKPDVEITQLKINPGEWRSEVIGMVRANTNIDSFWIALPIFDNENNLQTVGFTIVEELSAGEERGFECSLYDYDRNNVDLSNSRVEAIPYFGY